MGNNPWGAGPGWGATKSAYQQPTNGPDFSWYNPNPTGGIGAQIPSRYGASNIGNGAQPLNHMPMHSDLDLSLFSPEQLNRGDFFAGQMAEHGPWQPWMTDVNQWLAQPFQQFDDANPASGMRAFYQNTMDQYRNIMGSQQDQANRAAYFRMMGSGNMGGVLRGAPPNIFDGERTCNRVGE